MTTPITVAYGDGIGPEIMEAALSILKAAKADIKPEIIEVGKKVYESGQTSGIAPASWESIHRTKIILKAPITTPQGGGYKSLNVTLRKSLGLYANVRPVASYYPFVSTPHQVMDMVIVRENEEDLYTGIEHRQTDEVVQCLKLVSRTGCEKIVRYAFEYAVKNNRKKVSCMSKDNIMKMTDGLFHRTFNEIAKEYPNIANDHYIVDIGSARIAAKPEIFDVIVTMNLYGDIISDIAAEISGSVGLAGSSNVGDEYAMFEAIHGSAPDIAGQDIANPSGLLAGAVMMLVHIGQNKIATLVHNALLATIESGIHTADLYNKKISKKKVGTKDFAKAVIDHLGKKPKKLRAVDYAGKSESSAKKSGVSLRIAEKKELVGVDIFADIRNQNAIQVAGVVGKFKTAGLALQSISNRGLKVWPGDISGLKYNDHWCCRYLGKQPVPHGEILELLNQFKAAQIDFIKTENLYNFEGKPGFTAGQGE